ncbi:DDE-type integrase/transposase/recombinase [Hymenobacter setariae]|uniref:DDE-type integrase/transposase/recombinase n=1 Tax=Hymenobacter setariae TaxID=2594794 RepID=A0A558BT12_9BACT|nr:DDE-type integrase/transposase/recombinase [Hymenobacter setariae]
MRPEPTRQANQVWVSDITYLPLANGSKAYLCTSQAMVSNQVVGWHILAAMKHRLIINDLQFNFWTQPPTLGLLVHSDRNSRYCGKVHRKLLHDH